MNQPIDKEIEEIVRDFKRRKNPLDETEEFYVDKDCDWLTQALTTISQKAREEAEYTIHEVHGEGGRTVDGQTLYWAKVRKTLKDN